MKHIIILLALLLVFVPSIQAQDYADEYCGEYDEFVTAAVNSENTLIAVLHHDAEFYLRDVDYFTVLIVSADDGSFLEYQPDNLVGETPVWVSSTAVQFATVHGETVKGPTKIFEWAGYPIYEMNAMQFVGGSVIVDITTGVSTESELIVEPDDLNTDIASTARQLICS